MQTSVSGHFHFYLKSISMFTMIPRSYKECFMYDIVMPRAYSTAEGVSLCLHHSMWKVWKWSLKFLCDCPSSLQMEGADGESAGEVFLLCATNCPWELDTAFLRRFQRRIHIPLPCRWGPVSSGRWWGMVGYKLKHWRHTKKPLHYHGGWLEARELIIL